MANEIETNNKPYDCSISMVRLISTVLIVTCHMMQWAEMELAWWFNIGVQIFFCMSGYLYANRKIESIAAFYKKTFKKILIDYYIVIGIAIIVYGVLRPDIIFAARTVILEMFFAARTIPGGEHLWFIPYILFCYLCTPFLIQYVNKNVTHRKGKIGLLLWLSGFCLVVYFVTTMFFPRFNPAWITCYVIGVVIGAFENKNNFFRLIIATVIIIAMISNTVQIVTDYMEYDLYSLLTLGKIPALYKVFCDYAHAFLGISLFVILKSIFGKLAQYVPAKRVFQNIAKVSDRYSYDVYLVHQWFILGPFSMMGLTESRGLNIFLILIITAFSAYIVKKIKQVLTGKRVLPSL